MLSGFYAKGRRENNLRLTSPHVSSKIVSAPIKSGCKDFFDKN